MKNLSLIFGVLPEDLALAVNLNGVVGPGPVPPALIPTLLGPTLGTWEVTAGALSDQTVAQIQSSRETHSSAIIHSFTQYYCN